MDLKKYSRQILMSILVVSPIAVYFIASYLSYNMDPNQHRPWVSWYSDPAHEVYIGWETEEQSIGTVFYGKNPSTLTEGNTESELTNIHHLNITGLDSDTLYYYEIKINGQSLATGQFRTASENINLPFTFVMTADTQQPEIGPGGHYRLAKSIGNKNYTFLSIVGDFVADGADKQHWNNFFKVASAYTDTIPFAPVIGNHDMYERGPWFAKYFMNSANKTPTGSCPNGQFFYSFNWSSVHFTMCQFTYGNMVDFTASQMEWINQDLTNSQDKPFRIVMFHCPITAAGFFGRHENLINNLLPVMKQYNVSAVISGHEHNWERGVYLNEIHPGKDILYYDLGSGGSALGVGMHPQPETIVMTSTPCYTEVHATSTTLEFNTITFDERIIEDYILEAN